MLQKEQKADALYLDANNSLSKKIISKMAMLVAIIFLLTVLTAALLAARSLIQVNRKNWRRVRL